MKFLYTFFRRNFKVANSKIYISRIALDFLSASQTLTSGNSQSYIAIDRLPQKIKKQLGLDNKYIFEKIFYRESQSDSRQRRHLKKYFVDELTLCVLNYKQHYLNFLSYRLSECDAKAKAETLCLMRLIKHFHEKYHDPKLLYESFVSLKVKGEIICTSGKMFYRHITWLMRRGIFEGILFGYKHVIYNGKDFK